MTTSIDVNLIDYDLAALDENYDRISIFISDPKKLSKIVKLVDKKTKGAVKRAITSQNFCRKM